jgi:hypothetical protein
MREPVTTTSMIPLGSEWIDIRRLDAVAVNDHLRVATLGPRFTSSDIAVRYFTELLEHKYGLRGEVAIYATFDEAASAVIAGSASAIVVANAYSGVNSYYMDARLALAAVFIHPTPPYGLAGMPEVKLPQCCRIAVHPACIPLLNEMVPRTQFYEEVIAPSTSTAATMVLNKEVDLALTNAEAVRELGLCFISHTRRIQMVWSLFVRSRATQQSSHRSTLREPEAVDYCDIAG